MRARHRHFSCKSAGASLVLDSRYISGLSNNDLVNTWPDQSGNGYSPVPTLSPPIYKTSIQGGNPALSFEGSQDLYFNANLSNTNEISIITVVKYDNTSQRSLIIDAKNVSQTFDSFGLEINTYNSTGDHYDFYTSATSFEGSISVTTNFVILSITANTTAGTDIINNTSYYVNGLINTLTKVAGAGVYRDLSARNGFRIGEFNQGNYSRFRGDASAIFVFPYKINTPLLKRLEHASALSFKIPYQ